MGNHYFSDRTQMLLHLADDATRDKRDSRLLDQRISQARVAEITLELVAKRGRAYISEMICSQAYGVRELAQAGKGQNVIDLVVAHKLEKKFITDKGARNLIEGDQTLGSKVFDLLEQQSTDFQRKFYEPDNYRFSSMRFDNDMAKRALDFILKQPDKEYRNRVLFSRGTAIMALTEHADVAESFVRALKESSKATQKSVLTEHNEGILAPLFRSKQGKSVLEMVVEQPSDVQEKFYTRHLDVLINSGLGKAALDFAAVQTPIVQKAILGRGRRGGDSYAVNTDNADRGVYMAMD